MEARPHLSRWISGVLGGAAITLVPAPGNAQALINEVLADPGGTDANGDGIASSTQDEFVEIVSVASTPIDISGWTISDALSVRFKFANGIILAPGSAVVVFGGGMPVGTFGGSLVFTTGTSNLSLNNSMDTVTLRMQDGTIIDTVTYVSGHVGISITRSPEASPGSIWVQHSSAPGSGGAPYSPGTRVNGSPFSVLLGVPAMPMTVGVSLAGAFLVGGLALLRAKTSRQAARLDYGPLSRS
jgi:hypothetical protein